MSGQADPTIHYEIYTYDDNRWVLHARYRGNDKDGALDEAKSLERGMGLMVKVVKEAFYPATNFYEENTIYASERPLRAAPAPARPRYQQTVNDGYSSKNTPPSISDYAVVSPPPSSSTGSDTTPKAPPRDPVETASTITKITIIVTASVIGAAAITSMIAKLLGVFLQHGIGITGKTQSGVLFLTFAVTFLAMFVPLIMKRLDMSTQRAAARRKEQARLEKAPPLSRGLAAAPDLDEMDDAWDEHEETALTEEAEEEATEEEKTPEDETALAPIHKTISQLLVQVLEEVQRNRPNLDAYNKFGIDLILAGAADILGTRNNLSPADRKSVLQTAIQSMDTPVETAKSFADKYESYLTEPRYLLMVQLGRNAMEGFLDGTDTAKDQITPVFTTWNKPQSGQPSSRIMSVLFTDMVGSTDMTQSLGDKAAQEIVRRHNTIVRNALAEFSGKEIKHTGDGIMASFNSAAGGVEAAVAIQRAVAVHNGSRPDLPLHLRIGINAGEPIEEENDLFGSTVQLAARVCAAAQSDQIVCTNVVRELSTAKGLNFKDLGNHVAKGFKDPIPLYEVLWNG